MTQIIFHPIGTIHTPFKTLENMPIQPVGAKGVKATIELKNEFIDGLKDLEQFSHIILLYHFHQSEGYKLKVTPFMDTEERGLFSTRAPRRPNGIGMSIVRLIEIENNILHIEDVDILDGTPLVDIKPVFRQFDNRVEAKSGWLEEKWKERNLKIKSDKRFV
jgi:tRNA-Thr(GGU) m(6)t(6)A37 methyltransferase TsaA